MSGTLFSKSNSENLTSLSSAAEKGKTNEVKPIQSPLYIQNRLVVGQPNNKYKQEADRLAGQTANSSFQDKVQRKPWIMSNAAAHHAAKSLNAKTSTHQNDNWFGKGQCSEDSRLMPHELAHVEQQTRIGMPRTGQSLLQRQPKKKGDELEFKHVTGSSIRIPGLRTGQTDFSATGSPTSIEKRKSQERDRITGGFERPLSLGAGFATGAHSPQQSAIDTLIKQAGAQIDPKLVDAVRSAAADLYLFRVLSSFLLKEKGKLVAYKSGGQYDNKKSPPTIDVGTGGGPLDTRMTLVHELLHYMFDKIDTVYSEEQSEGSTEHGIMMALETRYLLVDMIRSGKPPLPINITLSTLTNVTSIDFAGFFGKYLKQGDILPKMEKAIADNDTKLLSTIVNQQSFVNAIVHSGLFMARLFEEEEENYKLTPDEWADLASMWAQNAMLVRRAMNEAVLISKKTGQPLRDVFATNEWKNSMSKFIQTLVLSLEKKSRQGVVALEKKL